MWQVVLLHGEIAAKAIGSAQMRHDDSAGSEGESLLAEGLLGCTLPVRLVVFCFVAVSDMGLGSR